jgi:Putative prokaryotic signal transducing protein
VSDLIALTVVGTEFEADMLCGLLRDAGIECVHRSTNMGAGAQDGMLTSGPREVMVRAEDVVQARAALGEVSP